MSTLYRDYRPKNFKEILGQKHIKITLQNEISNNHLAQAFLFCGPRAVGKTTMARVLTKAVNCTNRKEGEHEPCGECDNCKDIASGKHLDIIEIDAASNTGVDNVRENIISFSRIAPAKAKFKVFIIDEVHMLSPSAFNALLKIIEEPPTYVIFILATTEVHKVPQTIISRCERFDFKRIGISDVVTKLELIAKQEKKEVDPEVLEAVARRSGGHLRDAESLLGQIFSLGEKKISLEQAELLIPHYNNNEVITLLSHLSKKDGAKALAMINNLADAGVSMRNFISEIVFMLRKLAISKISPQLSDDLGLNLGDSVEMQISKISSELTVEELLYFIKRFLVAHSEKNQLISQLPLELAVMEICSGLNQPSSRLGNSPRGGTLNKETVVNRTNETPKSLDNTVKTEITKANVKAEEVIKVEAVNNTEEVRNVKQGSSNVCLNYEEVKEKWPEFLIKIKKHNHSLSFVLQNCEAQGVENGCINLVFKYKFHQDRVKDDGIRQIVESTLSEVFGVNLKINTSLNENISTLTKDEEAGQEDEEVMPEKEEVVEKPKKDDSLMNNLIQTFGGEVIN